jgi:hypothetical protein
MKILIALMLLSIARAQAPGDLRYTTNCVVVELNSVEGYVTNQSPDPYAVNGQVRFVFSAQDSMSRPAIVTPADSLIPPGKTVRVTSVKLTFRPQAGETCRFEVEGALRKI